MSRKDYNNNVGMHAPAISYSFEPRVSWIDITAVHKGGLFGSDYRMLFPSDGIAGIKKFFLDTLSEFFYRGLSCQPAIMGIGIGGSKDDCFRLGMEASCLRLVGSRNPEPEIAALEEEGADIKGMEGLKGAALLALGIRLDEAELALESAARKEPNRPAHRINLACVYMKRDRWKEAVAQLEQVLRNNMSCRGVYTLLGRCQEKLERWDKAATYYEKALQLDAGDGEAKEGLERLLRHL